MTKQVKQKRLTKWDIATMIDDLYKDLGNYAGRLPVYTWADYYTRQELVDHYNHLVRIHNMGRTEII